MNPDTPRSIQQQPLNTKKFPILWDGGANPKVALAHTNYQWASVFFFSYEPIAVLSCIRRCLASGGPRSRQLLINCVAGEARFVGECITNVGFVCIASTNLGCGIGFRFKFIEYILIK